MNNIPSLEELFNLADQTINEYLTDEEKQQTQDELNKLAEEIKEIVEDQDLE